MSYTLSLSQVDDLVITADLKDSLGSVVPEPDTAPAWSEDSAGAVIEIVTSDTTTCTVRKHAAGKANVTYSLGSLTGSVEVTVVGEPASVDFSFALVAVVAPPVAATATMDPALNKPLYTYVGSAEVDVNAWIEALDGTGPNGERLYTFAGDTAGSDVATGESAEWVPFTGAIVPLAALSAG